MLKMKNSNEWYLKEWKASLIDLIKQKTHIRDGEQVDEMES